MGLKRLNVLAALMTLLFVGGEARAQNTPFSSPALDSNCYFPQIGVPGEIDTIQTIDSGKGPGAFIHNLGPKPDGSFGNMLIGRQGPTNALNQSTNFFVTAATGPFDLHNFKARAQKFLPDIEDLRFGHFHNRSNVDILDAANLKIYWADDAGDYDSLRFTELLANIRHGDYHSGGGLGYGIVDPYFAYLTNDTVEDIVISCYSDYINEKDTAYLTLYRGGTQLASKDTAYEDTSAFLYPMKPNNHAFRICTQADFRGIGRDDLIVSDDSTNLCYYRNDRPFSLDSLAHAMGKDTIFTSWQNPSLSSHLHTAEKWFTMRALPKASTDNSVDFLPVFVTRKDSAGAIFMFRGGPDFGSHRITIDSAAFIIRHPAMLDFWRFYQFDFWPEGLIDAGDMTGTGNHVILTTANTAGAAEINMFYVTGTALDEKIDIYHSGIIGEAGADTLTADEDSLEDVMVGDPYSIPESEKGSLWVYKGTTQIPVHLNPKWADVKNIPVSLDGTGLSLSPNPITRGW
ncbi:MAG: hypothetical protein Q8922_00005, partial [Bacteroidota bacterium]|nr:hypothetical protein [Bacteroidota bacterium]